MKTADTQILVAEDDAHIRDGLVDTLESEGFRVLTAVDGKEAVEFFEQGGRVDLILLDLMMPKQNGYDVCRVIRKRDGRVPIIMLTAKSEEIDKVIGLELGADDYITKPFGVRELLARVHAVLRRSSHLETAGCDEKQDFFCFGNARVDRRRYEVVVNDQTYALTERELKLLDLFRSRPGQVLSRNYLLDQAWGIDYMGTTRTLDQHIAQLRKKIERCPAMPETIVTVHGLGYRYVPAEGVTGN